MATLASALRSALFVLWMAVTVVPWGLAVVIASIFVRGDPIYWIGPAGDAREAGEGTDFHAVANGAVSITPLQVDLTDHAALGNWAGVIGRGA